MKIKSYGKKALAVVGSMAMLAAFASPTFAATNTTQYVTVDVEKATLNGGYVVEPTLIELTSGMTALQALQAASSDVHSVSSQYGNYIDYVTDNDARSASNPYIGYEGSGYTFLTQANAADVQAGYQAADTHSWKHSPAALAADYSKLAAYDYNANSGWMVTVNNASPWTGADTALSAGDVVRLEYTVYSGCDLGFTGYPQDAAGTWATVVSPFTGTTDGSGNKVDKDDLITKIADINANYNGTWGSTQYSAIDAANSVVTNPTATPAVVSSALSALNIAFI
ncbi:DUF4430 domain-containing protein [Acetobacterium wieringae]|uniref:DUF4430 domain-containing protein n=1 Tax=Acetobacterium wieringae TaxID=52694 RepID=A0ABY6HFW8_9FIRM|nr:DUF4430 domain-containing protein [Acetobacterium wieringae]UYO63318.1 DUF4430 domain-containing protein [Acetobacterium wieringae]VUZ24074.1 Uncharacterised protein [Acetobacterium wieringae]